MLLNFCLCRGGGGPGSNSHEATSRLVQLKEDILQLDYWEQELDQHKTWVQQSIKNITDDVENQKLATFFLVI
jgi:transcription factor E2F4/5